MLGPLREASYWSYSFGDDAGSLLGTSDMREKKAKLRGDLDHLPMAVVSLQRLAQFRGVVWPILSRILAVGKCRVHVTGRILYRIGFHYTWTYI